MTTNDNVIGYSQLAKFKTNHREEALNPGGDKDDTDKDDPNKDDTEKGAVPICSEDPLP